MSNGSVRKKQIRLAQLCSYFLCFFSFNLISLNLEILICAGKKKHSNVQPKIDLIKIIRDYFLIIVNLKYLKYVIF